MIPTMSSGIMNSGKPLADLAQEYQFSVSTKDFPNLGESSYFFNAERFASQYESPNPLCFWMEVKGEPQARFVGFQNDGNLISPYRATFGSIELNEALAPEYLEAFIAEIISWCQENGLQEIQLKSWPACYDAHKSALLTHALVANGFEISQTDLNQHLVVDESPFWEGLHSSSKNKLNKAKKAGFSFQRLEVDRLDEAYALIKGCRDLKGYPTTMSYSAIAEMFQKFPEDYYLFGLMDGERLVACSVSIRINASILYNFYLADHLDYRSYSPLVMLHDELYAWCQGQGISIMDLGISTDQSVLNSSLHVFKRRLGCETSLKFSFNKTI